MQKITSSFFQEGVANSIVLKMLFFMKEVQLDRILFVALRLELRIPMLLWIWSRFEFSAAKTLFRLLVFLSSSFKNSISLRRSSESSFWSRPRNSAVRAAVSSISGSRDGLGRRSLIVLWFRLNGVLNWWSSSVKLSWVKISSRMRSSWSKRLCRFREAPEDLVSRDILDFMILR